VAFPLLDSPMPQSSRAREIGGRCRTNLNARPGPVSCSSWRLGFRSHTVPVFAESLTVKSCLEVASLVVLTEVANARAWKGLLPALAQHCAPNPKRLDSSTLSPRS
jgi:hypothetical protein